MQQSLESLQWVLPTQQVLEILRNSRSFALAKCLCRTKHKRCENPLEVCFYTNDVADKMVTQGAARRVSLQEAVEALKLANQHGLVHLTIYNPGQHVYALCSCCECCCHDIEFMQKLGRPDLVDGIKTGEVALVVNTPSGRQSQQDDAYIRKTASRYGIPNITTPAGALAAAKGIAARRQGHGRLCSLQEYVKAIR